MDSTYLPLIHRAKPDDCGLSLTYFAMNADSEKVLGLRDLLPATAAGIYLDTATLGPIPAETAAAMREADDWELRVGRVWEGRDDDLRQRAEEARAVIAALIGAEAREVTLTFGRDDALALARPILERGLRVIDVTDQVGVKRVDVGEVGVDAVAFACDRWLLAPEGTGALWLRGATVPAARRDLPRTALIGLARSVGWLEMYVGLEWIYERTASLAQRLFDALAANAPVEVLTPRADLCAIVAFRIPNWSAELVAEELSRRVQALVRPMHDLNAIRASVGWFNTEDELDRFARAVAELAAHTPETLPRRPSLIVLGSQ
jgi:selenocysteine lyase/cysteine desulfurase